MTCAHMMYTIPKGRETHKDSTPQNCLNFLQDTRKAQPISPRTISPCNFIITGHSSIPVPRSYHPLYFYSLLSPVPYQLAASSPWNIPSHQSPLHAQKIKKIIGCNIPSALQLFLSMQGIRVPAVRHQRRFRAPVMPLAPLLLLPSVASPCMCSAQQLLQGVDHSILIPRSVRPIRGECEGLSSDRGCGARWCGFC